MTKTKKLVRKSFGSLNHRFKSCQHLILKCRELFRFDIALRHGELGKTEFEDSHKRNFIRSKILAMSGFSRSKNKNIYFVYIKFQALRYLIPQNMTKCHLIRPY